MPTEYVLGKASTARSASGSGGAGSNRRVSWFRRSRLVVFSSCSFALQLHGFAGLRPTNSMGSIGRVSTMYPADERQWIIEESWFSAYPVIELEILARSVEIYIDIFWINYSYWFYLFAWNFWIDLGVCSLFISFLHTHLSFINRMGAEKSSDQKAGEAGHQDRFQDE